jgi:hypothetical protein
VAACYATRVYGLAGLRGLDAQDPTAQWEQLLVPEPAAPEGDFAAQAAAQQPGPFLAYYGPTRSLIVFGPATLQKQVEDFLALLKKATQPVP